MNFVGIESVLFAHEDLKLGGAIEYFCDPDYVSARWSRTTIA